MSSNLRPRNAPREVPRRVPLGLVLVYVFVSYLHFDLFGAIESRIRINSSPATTTADEPSKDLLKAAQNPISDLISVPILNMTTSTSVVTTGPNVLAFQPVIPANLSENWMLIGRIILPITSQPYPDKSSEGEFGLGDMTPSFFGAQNPAA